MARILIIDNEEMMLEIIQEILEREGYETVGALGGEEGGRALLTCNYRYADASKWAECNPPGAADQR